jgi:hypothetical protein
VLVVLLCQMTPRVRTLSRPFHFRPKAEPFVLGGVYDVWKGGGQVGKAIVFALPRLIDARLATLILLSKCSSSRGNSAVTSPGANYRLPHVHAAELVCQPFDQISRVPRLANAQAERPTLRATNRTHLSASGSRWLTPRPLNSE